MILVRRQPQLRPRDGYLGLGWSRFMLQFSLHTILFPRKNSRLPRLPGRFLPVSQCAGIFLLILRVFGEKCGHVACSPFCGCHILAQFWNLPQSIQTCPGLGRGSTPTAFYQANRLSRRLMHSAPKKVGDGREPLPPILHNRFGRTLHPVSLDIGQGMNRSRPLHKEQTDLGVIGLGNLLLGIPHPPHPILHIRLPRAHPDSTHQDIINDDRVLPVNCHFAGKASFDRFKCHRPTAIRRRR